MNRIEKKGLLIISGVMGIWILLGSVLFLLFFPENTLTMIHYTFSVYFPILTGVGFYFLIKKAFSDLAETGLKSKKGKKKK